MVFAEITSSAARGYCPSTFRVNAQRLLPRSISYDELEHRRASGKADYVKALADEVQRGGLAAWKALRDMLPRDEVAPAASPSVSFGQLFVAAHKEINRLEQAKTVPQVIDATAEAVAEGGSEEEKVEW